MPQASPAKWHLAHTTWFFETFVLEHLPGHRPHRPEFRHLFNSYYVGVGPAWSRPARGLLTRPSLAEVRAYRDDVDARIVRALERGDLDASARERVVLGLHHEQQHQELLLTDLKHLFGTSPLRPVYVAAGGAPAGVAGVAGVAGSAGSAGSAGVTSATSAAGTTSAAVAAGPASAASAWRRFAGGLVEVGHAAADFAFDNEGPRHATFLAPFELATRPVTNGEWLAFVRDGGYRRADLWLSDGVDAVRAQGWTAPLHWTERDGAWFEFTLHGERPLALDAPVAHVSWFEADAFARWRGARLPTEFEWEHATAGRTVEGRFADDGTFHPRAPEPRPGLDTDLEQLFGDVWEWTSSDYAPYPGFRPWAGDVGEYNGKFMSGQRVLRGGSCATPRGHVRATYRNFFPPDARWQFSGVRLARDTGA